MNGLALSLDPHTLDLASGRQKVAYIDPEGELIYEEPKLPGHDLAEQLGRIWHEYPDGLLDVTEAKLAALPAGDAAYTAPDEVDKEKDGEARAPGQALTHEEMHEMRMKVQDELNAARNELWFVLELAKTLAASSEYQIDPPEDPLAARNASVSAKKQKLRPQGHGQGQGSGPTPLTGPSATTSTSAGPLSQASVEPPVLPPGTLTTTPASLSTGHHAHAADTYSLQLALAAKERAVNECEALIDAAVEEMQGMSDAADGFWASVRALQGGSGGADGLVQGAGKSERGATGGQWAILPKPDFAGVMRAGELSRDVVIPYALDEAPPAIRARCLAAFDLDPNSKQPLAFGARTYMRMRVLLHDHNQPPAQVSASTIPPAPDDEDVTSVMQAVQDESIDEELFGEIRAEIIRLGGSVEGRTAELDVGSTGQRLTFELYDSRKPPSPPLPTDPQDQLAACDIPDLILLSARYLLLQLHRQRKADLVASSSSTVSAKGDRSIVMPIIQALLHFIHVRQIQEGLEELVGSLQRAGLTASLEKSWSGETVISTEEGTRGQGLDGVWGMVGGTMAIEMEGLSAISISLLPGAQPRITLPNTTTSRSTFPTDALYVPSTAATGISTQLLSWAYSILVDRLSFIELEMEGEEGAGESVFLDELDESVALGHGSVRFGVLVEEGAVRAEYEPFEDGLEGRVYVSSAAGAGTEVIEGQETLRDWLYSLI